MLDHNDDSGALIAFEGIDGSGKTTQRRLFKTWLEGMGRDVVVTKWNSSPLFKPIIKARKAARTLDPVDYAVLHAADFRHRYENQIWPALLDGRVVLADRYVFTGLARDAARGMSRDWSTKLYAPVRRPDIVFYFSAAPETCACRIAATRAIKFYEAGQDVTGIEDPRESYLKFTRRVLNEYEKLSREFQFVIVDAEKSIFEQHCFIRETWEERLSLRRHKPVLNVLYSPVDV